MGLGLAASWLLVVNHRNGAVGAFVPQIFLIPGLATVGAVVAARSGNRVGWLFLGIALVLATTAATFEYAVWPAVPGPPHALPGASIAAWISNWLWPLNWVGIGLLLLGFPDGDLPSRRWRPVAFALFGSGMGAVVFSMFLPKAIEVASYRYPNPVVVESIAALRAPLSTWLGWLLAAPLIFCVAAPLSRRRHADALERQQLKWFSYVVSMTALIIFAAFASIPIQPQLANVLGILALLSVSIAMPGSIGFAIMRYRLFEIDRIINRTLVYAGLTVVLSVTYVGSVFVVGNLIRGASHQAGNSFTVAASTLIVASLFRPSRNRVQGFIDRSFYRQRYDATRILDNFSARLRDEIDLDALNTELVMTVRETMKPTHVSLWLRSPTASNIERTSAPSG